MTTSDLQTPVAGPAAGRGRGAPLVLVLGTLVAVAAVLGLLVVGGGAAAPPVGLPDAGAVARWGLPVARLLQDLATCATVGLLVLAAVVLPDEVAMRAVRISVITGTLWIGAGVVALVLTYADAAGLRLDDPAFGAGFGDFVTHIDLGRSLTASLVVVGVVNTVCALATKPRTAGPAAVLALAALFPVALTGHSGGSVNHEVAVNGLAGHLVGVTVWVGGLAALVMLRGRLGGALPVVVARFSRLAGWCFALVVVSGLVSAWLRLASLGALGTSYGVLVLVKVLAVVVLGAAGWAHRRLTVRQLADAPGSVATFWRLVAGELAVMGLAIGAGVALSRTAPPVTGEGDSADESLLGQVMPPPMSPSRWLLVWQADTLWLTVAVLAAGLYVAGVVRLRRRGDAWPVGRTLLWLLGCVLLVWATSSGPGAYGRLLFSAHMVGHMTVSMVVPALLVLGAPITLALRTLRARDDGTRGPREWVLAVVRSRYLHVLSHPIVAAGIFGTSLIVFYYSPLFELSLRTHTGHVLMDLHFLLAGYLFANVLVGVDPGPPRPAYPLRLVLLFATLSFHAFFGVALVSGSQLLAPDWFSVVPHYGSRTPLADQQYGGALAWGMGELPTLALALGVAVAWVRSDEREARRSDRRADRDGDAELTAYNARLADLARRDTRA